MILLNKSIVTSSKSLSVKTESDWFGPIMRSPMPGNIHTLQWNISFPASKCCPGLIALPDDQVAIYQDLSRNQCLDLPLDTLDVFNDVWDSFTKLDRRLCQVSHG